MYTLIRKIHRYTALCLTLFIVMYAISGLVIFRPNWFPNNQVVTNRSEAIDWERPDFGQEDQAVLGVLTSQAETFREAFGISARYESTRKEEGGGYTLVYRKPGVEERVTAYVDHDNLTLTTIHNGAVRTWSHMHKMHRFEGGPVYFLWGVLLDIVGLSVIVFAVSGVWLWYKLKAKKRRLGWILLCSSVGYTLGSIIYVMV